MAPTYRRLQYPRNLLMRDSKNPSGDRRTNALLESSHLKSSRAVALNGSKNSHLAKSSGVNCPSRSKSRFGLASSSPFLLSEVACCSETASVDPGLTSSTLEDNSRGEAPANTLCSNEFPRAGWRQKSSHWRTSGDGPLIRPPTFVLRIFVVAGMAYQKERLPKLISF